MAYCARRAAIGDGPGIPVPQRRAGAIARVAEDRFPTIVRESPTIAGWVAMWRPMRIFLYPWRPIARQRRVFHRLANAWVRVVNAARLDPDQHAKAAKRLT